MDLGHWMRMASLKDLGGPDLAAVYASGADIRGSKFDPAASGMKLGSALIDEQKRTGAALVALPFVEGYGISLLNKHEVNIVDRDSREVAGSQFPEPHPADWLSKVSADGKLVMITGALAPAAAANLGELFEKNHIGVLSLMAWTDEHGVTITED